MVDMKNTTFALLFSLMFSTALLAQDAPQQTDQSTGQDQMPVFRVNVYARTTKAVNYRHLSRHRFDA
jgi:hypothetical protein